MFFVPRVHSHIQHIHKTGGYTVSSHRGPGFVIVIIYGHIATDIGTLIGRLLASGANIESIARGGKTVYIVVCVGSCRKRGIAHRVVLWHPHEPCPHMAYPQSSVGIDIGIPCIHAVGRQGGDVGLQLIVVVVDFYMVAMIQQDVAVVAPQRCHKALAPTVPSAVRLLIKDSHAVGIVRTGGSHQTASVNL